MGIYAEANGGRLFHYRDNSDLEADAIIELDGGEWGAFEIKLGEHQVAEAASTLLRLKAKMIAAEASPPKFLAVITGGGLGQRRKDGVYVIPINSLRD